MDNIASQRFVGIPAANYQQYITGQIQIVEPFILYTSSISTKKDSSLQDHGIIL